MQYYYFFFADTQRKSTAVQALSDNRAPQKNY